MKKNYAVFPLIIVIVFILITMLIPSQLSGINFDVPDNYSTVQAAINSALSNANPVDYIYIARGNYLEGIVINIPAGNTLYLIGAASDGTVLDGGGVHRVIRIEGNGIVHINNMTITNGIAWGAGIGVAAGSTLYLENCMIINNHSGSHGGGIDNNGTIYATNCKISGNTASISGAGIYNDGGTLSIEKSSISGNISPIQSGLAATNPVMAINNWWGSTSGPSGAGPGTGDSISAPVLYSPWLTYDPFEMVAIRIKEMTCYRVWINEDNKFQFVFWYPYKDNNWVRIYDASGKMVYEIDMPYDDPNLIVDLPDGMYTVKTYHDQPEPLQEFIIGKP